MFDTDINCMAEAEDFLVAIGIGVAAALGAIAIIKILDDISESGQEVTAEELSRKIGEGW